VASPKSTIALEEIDRELAILANEREARQSDVEGIARRIAEIDVEVSALKRVRQKMVAAGLAGKRTRLSTTREIRRLLLLRPLSSDELASELAGRIKDRSTPARKLIFSTVNQMIGRGEIRRDSDGLNHIVKSRN
jgi:hypothetical protein